MCTSSRVFFEKKQKRRVELSVIGFAITLEDGECEGGANVFIERNPTERERERERAVVNTEIIF